MSQWQKLIQKILEGKNTSYEEAKNVLFHLGFELKIRGSHHIFRKNGYIKNVSIKRRSQLLPYQMRDLKEILRDHEY